MRETREKALGRAERRRGGSEAEMRVITLRRRVTPRLRAAQARSIEWTMKVPKDFGFLLLV